MITAYTYCRVSTDEQATHGLSLDAQLAECRRYAARHDFVLGAEYTDILSGLKDHRPSYQQLLADIRQLRAQGVHVVVVVAALDRFGRRLEERIRCREELKALGVAVHSVREGGEVSDLVANILGSVAQEEVRRLGERVKASRRYVADRGFRPQGRAPWGYVWRPATLEERAIGAPISVLDVAPEIVPYVVELFGMLASGSSVRLAARWTASLPVEVRQGKVLAFSAVARILRSPTYIARPHDASGDVLAYPLTRWPAIIDDATWVAVQARIDDHAVHHRQASGRYLLTGYLKCPSCGGLISGRRSQKPRRPTYLYYQCVEEQSRGNVVCNWGAPARAIDIPVLDLVGRVLAPLASPDLRAELTAAWREIQEPDDVGIQRKQRIATLAHEAERARKSLTTAASLFVDGDLDRAGYDGLRDLRQAEMLACETELGRLRAVIPFPTLPPIEMVLAHVGGWRVMLGAADVNVQREVLAALVARVHAVRTERGRYGVRVTWTVTGQALAELSEVGVHEPEGLHVVPFARLSKELRVCARCGCDYLGYAHSRYCGKSCRLAAWRKRRAARLAFDDSGVVSLV